MMENLKVLVPVDFSELSLKAFTSAQDIVAMFGGTITPLYAVKKLWRREGLFEAENEIPIDYENLKEEAADKLDHLAANHLDQQYLQPSLVETSNPAQHILDSSQGFDLIVMSSHGRSGIKRMLMGSVTEKVLQNSNIPVLVVEETPSLNPINRILLTTDFSESSFVAFPWAVEIAKKTGAVIELVHVISIGLFYGQGARQLIDRYGSEFMEGSESKMHALIEKYFSEIPDQVKPRLITTHQSVHEALYKLTREHTYNLVVISSVGHTGLKFFLLGSTATHVARHVSLPVLVIHSD